MGEAATPFAAGSDTSLEAAESMEEHARTLVERVYAVIAQSPDGATCDEVEKRLGLSHQTVSPRVWDLHHNLGRIVDSGARRTTRSGRKAVVYLALAEVAVLPRRVRERRRAALVARARAVVAAYESLVIPLECVDHVGLQRLCAACRALGETLV